MEKVMIFKFFQGKLIEMYGTKVYGGRNGTNFICVIAVDKRRLIVSSMEGKIKNNFIWYNFEEGLQDELRSRAIETFYKRCYNKLTKLEEDKEQTIREIKYLNKIKEELSCQKD